MTSTIHQEIDELLTADLHDQLRESERKALHLHLVECAGCRQLHKEYQNMNTALSDSFEAVRPTPGFENRILSAFNNRVPDRGAGVVRFLVLAMRSRATRLAAVAALLLALLQLGRMITGERSAPHALAYVHKLGNTAPFSLATRKDTGSLENPGAIIVTGGNIPTADQPAPAEDFSSLAKNASVFSKDSGVAERRAYTIAGVGNETTHTTRPNSYYGMIDSPQKGEAAYAKKDKAFADLRQEPAKAAAPAIAATPLTSQAQASTAAEESALYQRKLIRNATTELEVVSFNDTVEKIATLAKQAHGFLATSNSAKQENGKLRGQLVVKVLPDSLDSFLQKLRDLGELKNQNIGTEDVTKNYFDTTSRLSNARVMEQRLVDMLKTKTGKVSDLLQVEKELARVREDIEKMQGELKYIDAQVQFATVTVTLAEKDMNVPAAFLLRERARVGLFTPDVQKTYDAIKALASEKVQISNAQLDTASAGRTTAHINILIEPDQSQSTISKIKELGRVQTFEVQTERVSRGGEGMSENAKTEKDKVQVEVTISREEEEQSQQQTSLRLRSSEVDQNAQKVRDLAGQQGGQIRYSSFNKDSDGREIANISVRLPMQNYAGFMQSLGSFGRMEDLTVHREERKGQTADEKTAPVDVSIQFYSRGNIVADNSGVWATLRRTLGEGAGALTWSVRMIGVALAFLAPWAAALVAVIWIVRRIRKARAPK